MIGQGWRWLRPMLGRARPLLVALVVATAVGSVAETGALVLVAHAALDTAVDTDALGTLPGLGPTSVAGSLWLAAGLAVLTLSLHAVGDRSSRVRLLRGLAATLPPAGPVLLSSFTREDDLVPNLVHRFTRDEIEAELASAGLRLVAFAPPGPGSPGLRLGDRADAPPTPEALPG